MPGLHSAEQQRWQYHTGRHSAEQAHHLITRFPHVHPEIETSKKTIVSFIHSGEMAYILWGGANRVRLKEEVILLEGS